MQVHRNTLQLETARDHYVAVWVELFQLGPLFGVEKGEDILENFDIMEKGVSKTVSYWTTLSEAAEVYEEALKEKNLPREKPVAYVSPGECVSSLMADD